MRGEACDVVAEPAPEDTPLTTKIAGAATARQPTTANHLGRRSFRSTFILLRPPSRGSPMGHGEPQGAVPAEFVARAGHGSTTGNRSIPMRRLHGRCPHAA